MHGIDRIEENILVLPVILILYLHYRPLLPTLKTTLPIPKKIHINHICELCEFGRKKIFVLKIEK